MIQHHRLKIVIAFGILTIGVTGASAIPTCQQLIKVYKEKLVKNTVSHATQAKWAAWNKTHPNFKPKSRPKYKLATEEVIQKIAFDCQVPTDQVQVSIDLVPMTFEPKSIAYQSAEEPPTDIFAPPLSTDLTSDSSTPTDSEVSYVPLGSFGTFPGMPIGVVPVIPPVTSLPPVAPPIIAPVPEPASLVFVLTGAGLVFSLKANKAVA